MEGETDKRVIPYLMEANGVTWPDPPGHPVSIEPYGSVDEVLKPGVIEAELKETGREALGVVVDTNGNADARWDQLRAMCDSEFAGLPDRIPAEGLEVAHSVGARFGVWIMPDNRFKGMLEDLLVRLVPDDPAICTKWPGIASPGQEGMTRHSEMYTRARLRSTHGSRGRTRRDSDCTKP